MSFFLKELFNLETLDQKLLFVRDIQCNLDDWCSEYLFDIRMKYSDLLKELVSLKDKEIESTKKKKNEEIKNKLRKSIQFETEWCTNFSKLLLDMSGGIESTFCEMSEICETTKRNDTSLIKELDQCNTKLSELAAKLLMNGIAIELMEMVMRYWFQQFGLKNYFNEKLKIEISKHTIAEDLKNGR